MKKFALMKILALSAIVVVVIFVGCDREREIENEEIFQSKFIEELTINNYPRVDGSTSNLPLNTVIFCELLGIDYQWKQVRLPSSLSFEQWGIEPALYGNNGNSQNFWDRVKSSQTHQSFINLIDNKTDLSLSARKMSPDEKEYANINGVTLIETPIALDAFIFLVNPFFNPITSLTIEEIRDIYTGKITNWNEVGGNDIPISPLARNPNSGSQELMESLVMNGLDLAEFPIMEITTMGGVFDAIFYHPAAISYTVRYYREYILRDRHNTKVIAIEGIHPSDETINNRSYPLVANVYAVIRDDLDKLSMAYKVYEFLQTEEGKQIIAKSGYVLY